MIHNSIKKVLVLGSGALKIGEAGEFDYSGSQAIKALKEEGLKTVLVNPNIATFQTSKDLADKVYFLPVNDFFVEKIIKKEKPDGILLSFGGQTALNCGVKLYEKGVLKKYGVEVLGNPITSIILSEDRKKFANHLATIGVKTPKSNTAKSTEQALKIAKELGYPVMVRSGFALGGQGSGIAQNKNELKMITEKALTFVPHILVEKYLHHFKEIEYEIVRDIYDNCITVCNMENLDPMGIHTGESIVVAPSQTLNNYEYHTLRTIAIKIVRSLKIVGECNVQFALNPQGKVSKGNERYRRYRKQETSPSDTFDTSGSPSDTSLDYYVIELNARLSRSSALASKATGYPLAYVAAKLALSKSLTEITNKVTQVTKSAFEPSLDYVVVKIPRWDIAKFKRAKDTIGSSMKSVGEVMGIGRTFEEALQKAIRMLDLDLEGTTSDVVLPESLTDVKAFLAPTSKRIFALSKALTQGISIQKIHEHTGIDPWFLYRLENIINEEQELKNKKLSDIPKKQLIKLKQTGFSDKRIGEIVGVKGLEVRALRKKFNVFPSVFQIDTLAAEFPAQTNYLYLTYNGNHNDVEATNKKGVIVLGSGPYRIGSSVEFDWTSVNTVLALKEHNKESIIINCNPETVSTDYDISNRLYFEELTFERIADIYEFENPYGVIVSVGGQTPNNRAEALKQYGFNILGTDPANIDRAEDRNKFSNLLDKLCVKQPAWESFANLEDAKKFCRKIKYPVLIRPSYVLSGSAMNVCYSDQEFKMYVQQAAAVSKEYPLTISKFVENAKEIELDAVASKGEIVISIISTHVEDAGVHSGDATIVLPAQNVNEETTLKLNDIAKKLANALVISGPFNIQFLAKNNNLSVIEINLRSSRTFPFISKVTGVNFIEVAVNAFFGKVKKVSLQKLKHIAVKVPQFSFSRLTGADPILHVEMASTGEVACFGETVEEAFLKGEISTGGHVPAKGMFISLGGDVNKKHFEPYARYLAKSPFLIFSTDNTAKMLRRHGVKVKTINKIYERKHPNILDIFEKGEVDVAIDTYIESTTADNYLIRRSAIDHNISLFTNIQKAELYVKAITKDPSTLLIKSWDEYTK